MPTEVKLDLNAKLPGTEVLVAIFEYATVVRATMSQENRDRQDALNMAVLEDFRKFWLKMGLLG